MHSLALNGAMAIAGALLIAGAASSPVFAETVFTVVPGPASPYLAGMPPGSTCCLDPIPPNDTAPAQSPAQVLGIPLVPGTVLTFSVSGGVSNQATVPPTNIPDGDAFFTSPFTGLPGTDDGNGIARMNAPVNALVGVFLDDGVPSTSPAPPGLDFSDGGLGRAFGQLCPGLKQPFFIGDGLTGHGAGAPQQFVVPGGATRLFLGTVDGFDWNTNIGAYGVQVTSTTPMSIATGVNQPVFGVGQTMMSAVILNSQAQAGAADFFTGLLHPDGSTIEFVTSGGARRRRQHRQSLVVPARCSGHSTRGADLRKRSRSSSINGRAPSHGAPTCSSSWRCGPARLPMASSAATTPSASGRRRSRSREDFTVPSARGRGGHRGSYARGDEEPRVQVQRW